MAGECSSTNVTYTSLLALLASVSFVLQGCYNGSPGDPSFMTSTCEEWCDADQWKIEKGKRHKERHCGGDMSSQCGSCPHCGGDAPNAPCEGWCKDDQWKIENGISHKDRHCDSGDMSDHCGGCPHCSGHGPAPTPSAAGDCCANCAGRPHCSPRSMMCHDDKPFGKDYYHDCGGSDRGPSNPAPVPAPIGGGSKIRFLTYNVWWRNRHYSDLANMIQDTVVADIVSLQEAVRNPEGEIMAQKIVDALNAKGSGRWALANEWGSSHWWCGLQIYRSDKFDLEWHREVGHTQHHSDGRADARGICGALLKRKSDNVKACVWGTHPVPRGTAQWANEMISVGRSAIRECSNMGAPTVFMCDCNDWLENQGGKGYSVLNHLKSETGLDFVYGHSGGIDHIFVESSMGSPQGGTTIAAGPRGGCQNDCSRPQWGYSDHAPVFVDVMPR